MNAAVAQIHTTTSTDAFVAAMRNTVNCVAVVASQGLAGRAGITVSSMVPVSAEPPMLLVCINRASPSHDVITANGRFSVNVLGTQQRAIADRFAGRGERPYQFEEGVWRMQSPPMLAEAAAQFDCELDGAVAAGTHTILVGRVRRSRAGKLVPLCYSDRNYARAEPLRNGGTNSVLETRHPQLRLAGIESPARKLS